MIFDTLAEKIKETKAPICVGLDTKYDFLPDDFKSDIDILKPFKTIAKDILRFNKAIINNIFDIVPSVKIQIACYEMYGYYGMKTYKKTIDYAKKKGLIVIADAKRNDIGSTAAAYSAAFLGGVQVAGKRHYAYDADILTVTPYLGSDGIDPFLADMKTTGKGIFVLVKTSNPSSGEFQDKLCEGKQNFMHVADKVDAWGSDFIGKSGYSSVGAVVGATYKNQALEIRDQYKNMFFLIPGYGAQGATGQDIAVSFDKNGGGAIVNSSRGILLAYKKEAYKALRFEKAARQATLDMKMDIITALSKMGITL
jgi:orotidine-5'-phosphate decarboxylase